MQTKDALTFALTMSDRAVLSSIEEMRDRPTTFPTPKGGCHPLWVLGHLSLIEGGIPNVLFGEPNPVADWYPLFGEGSEPVADASAYPAFDEVLAKYRALRANNLSILAGLSEADLDRATAAPPKGREREFATFGQTFLVLAMHQILHRGNVTDARRAAGQGTVARAAAGAAAR